MTEETRVDQWLCAVRLVKTRPMATQLCVGGHVRVNGNPAKPSTTVRPGDEVHALIAAREDADLSWGRGRAARGCPRSRAHSA